jgi:hypothetical protein
VEETNAGSNLQEAMNRNYEANLNRLQQEIQADGARPTVVDAAITKLFESSNESLPRDLLLLLSDNAEYDESMFSVIHAAETSNDEQYIRAVLSIFTDIMRSALVGRRLS